MILNYKSEIFCGWALYIKQNLQKEDIKESQKIILTSKTITPKKYLKIENILQQIAKKTNLNLAELDLYLWYSETGKVLK